MSEEMKQKREGFASRLGFILVSAGCAIGIGNVWKFPYVAGQCGGAIFVIFYLIFLVLMGIPILTMELAIGRGSGKTIVAGYKKLENDGSRWHLHGWVCLLGNYLLMMYYTTVAGWMLAYFWKFLTGAFTGIDVSGVGDVFGNLLASPKEMTIFMAVIVIAGFMVISFGVQDGLEKVNKVMMLALLGLILVLAFHSMTLKGGSEGIKFYLLPNIDSIKHVGLVKVITAAMNQAFFTLSLGIAAMEIFGSYMSKDYALTGEAVRIGVLDTFVALVSGLIIFPACFSFGIEPDQGPGLIFVTLPSVFIGMNGGRIWGTLFFLFMTFASFSTVTAVFENIVASSIDNMNWSRKKSVIINCIIILIASMPCLLGYNVLNGLQIIGERDILDSEDFIVSNLLLPIGSLIFLLFCVTKKGWGEDEFLDEVNTGKGLKMSKTLMPYFRYILPILIIIIIISGLL